MFRAKNLETAWPDPVGHLNCKNELISWKLVALEI